MQHFEEGQALRYDNEVDLENHNTSLAQLTLLAGRDKRVLEVGPATGYMTRALAARGCRVTGIEIDPAAARLAEPHCERMIVGDIESMDLAAELGDARFDVIVFGDVLEHLMRPRAVLEQVAGLLSPEGYVVASIPNVAHASVRLALLAGRFRYTPEGLLDRGHIRLFDHQEVAATFAEAGYEILEESRIAADVFETEILLREDAFPRHLVSTVRGLPEALTYQFIVKAAPVPERVGGRRGPWFRSDPQEAELPPLNLDPTLSRLESELDEALTRLRDLETRHERVTRSAGYRLLQGVRERVERHAPWGTRRRSLLMAPARAVRLLADRGIGGFLAHLAQPWKWIPRLGTRALPDIERLTPPERYALWLHTKILSPRRLRRMRRRARRLAYRPLVSVVMPVHNTRPEWLRAAIASMRDQVYDRWELCIADDASSRAETRQVLAEEERRDPRVRVTLLEEHTGISGTSNAALATATGELVGFLDHDDELKPNALYEVVALLNERRDIDFIYSDEDKRDMDGWLVEPSFKPDWSPDLLLATHFPNHFSVYRREIVDRLAGLREGYDGSQDHDLALRVTEVTDRIAHITLPLYTWRKAPGSAAMGVEHKPQAYLAGRRAIEDALERRGIGGTVEDGIVPGHHRVRYAVEGDPKIVVVVAAPGDPAALRRCVESVAENTSYANVEVLVAGMPGGVDVASLPWRQEWVLPAPEGAGRFEALDRAARAATERGADLLLFLDGDHEVLSPGWVEAMLEHAHRDEVAVVGARLLDYERRPAHEGIIVGPGAGEVVSVSWHQYLSLGDTVRNCSAVSGSCLMVRAGTFWELGGFDEGFEAGLADVDLCLRAREKGKAIVYTPYALARRSRPGTPGAATAADRTLHDRRWSGYRDPYVNPNLDVDEPHELRMLL